MSDPLAAIVLYTIPSTRRPDNVELMSQWHDAFVWVVADKKDFDDYKAAGAEDVHIQREPGLAGARNTCLALANQENMFCLQVDDDLRGLWKATGNQTGDKDRITLPEAAGEVLNGMLATDSYLGGVLSTHNPFFSGAYVHTWAFICGQLCMLAPTSEWGYWDKSFSFKDDWELTCRHLQHHGKVARVDYILPDSSNRGAGGLNQHRTLMKEIEAAKRVIKMYPEIVRKHSRRTGQLQLIHNRASMPDSAREAWLAVNGTSS